MITMILRSIGQGLVQHSEATLNVWTQKDGRQPNWKPNAVCNWGVLADAMFILALRCWTREPKGDKLQNHWKASCCATSPFLFHSANKSLVLGSTRCRSWTQREIENQTLLVIGDYSLSLVNPKGGCFKTIEKPVAAQLHLFYFTVLTKAWY